MHHDHIMGVGHNCSAFSMALYRKTAGYDAALCGPQDTDMDLQLRAALPAHRPVVGLADGSSADPMGPSLSVAEWFYVYRWGMHGRHLSSHAKPQQFYDDIGRDVHRHGEVELLPQFTKPWLDLVWKATPKPPDPAAWQSYPLWAWKN
jgi:hypothetical protein